MKLHFNKFQGTGNDFVMIDGREDGVELSSEQIKKLCDRKFGIGADGLIIIRNLEGYDFEMKYYNANGHEGSMCGNGGRCAVQYAKKIGILKKEYHFMAVDGEHLASIDLINGWVNLKMKDVDKIHQINGDFVLDTGSPHYVKHISNDLKDYDVYKNGYDIRHSEKFPEGINVNFVEQIDDSTIFVRTFERGVEDETLSCGTGATASALVFAHNERSFNRVDVETPGGSLAVDFVKKDEDVFSDIWLCGPATFVYEGSVIM